MGDRLLAPEAESDILALAARQSALMTEAALDPGTPYPCPNCGASARLWVGAHCSRGRVAWSREARCLAQAGWLDPCAGRRAQRLRALPAVHGNSSRGRTAIRVPSGPGCLNDAREVRGAGSDETVKDDDVGMRLGDLRWVLPGTLEELDGDVVVRSLDVRERPGRERRGAGAVSRVGRRRGREGAREGRSHP